MEKYEISLWEDYQKDNEPFLRERKIAVIGSDTMAKQGVQARALEPNLVEEINGTHTLTFRMQYTYTDNRTGEKYENPFGRYLINERKVKVFWKNKWYDLVIKKCQEDTSKKSVVYTCTDLFINELSKQGYSLEFNTELQNNIGTVQELAEQVLKDSTWQYGEEHPIIQKTEGPTYATTLKCSTRVTRQYPEQKDYLVDEGKKILVFYDSVLDYLDSNSDPNNIASCQFLYIGDDENWITDINDAVVQNGICCEVRGRWILSTDAEGNWLSFHQLQGSNTGTQYFKINLTNGISSYRGERLVRSQKTTYEPLLGRYVLMCQDGDIPDPVYEIATTEYTNPLAVINLFANPKDFTNLSGWIGSTTNAVEKFELFPKFGDQTAISTYVAHSYLKIKSGKDIYNSGIQSNISYFTPTDTEVKKGIIGGIQKGEKYIFRFKARANENGAPSDSYINTGIIEFNLYKYNSNYTKNNDNFVFGEPVIENINDWVEYTLIANKAVSASKINEYGIFINSTAIIWIEDIQLFKYQVGKTSYDKSAEEKRINPGEINLQSVVKPVYKYYKRDSKVTKADELTYIYIGEEENSNYPPIYNNYEKIITIEEKESNRFNILQSIAETAQAWIKFDIKHNEDGSIKITDGVPEKYVYFIQEIGEDTGISFEYGIDLKTISRTIDSDKLATKIIVKPNSNEFAPNGFCSIARSDLNYSKENFILNLDYYIQQNLLDKDSVTKDLYSTQDNYIGYYYHLRKLNKEYDDITEELQVKNLDLTKQKAQAEVYSQYISAGKNELENLQDYIIKLANVNSWAAAQKYAHDHIDNEKIQSHLNACGKTKQQIADNEELLRGIKDSIDKLEKYIDSLKNRQIEILEGTETPEGIIKGIKQYHQQFNNKYGLYLLEGTWQDEDYVDADKYYLDALNVAYTSSRPQLSYNINVLRLSSLEEYSSKVFHLGDICYMQDREFFGYLSDKITPYKEKILVSKISSFFDQPEKDVLTIQNYKTRFDDLFQRIAAATQSLQYAEGSYAKAAEVVNPDKTLSFAALQDTFDLNESLVMNSSNQDITWDETGITLTNKFNSADKTKIIAGGIFVTNDGGETWKNAIRGDGISADVITTGRLNTGEVYIYDGNVPSFRWDNDGITAYALKDDGSANTTKFVRHDKYGFYGYQGTSDFVPTSIDQIEKNSRFGLTWNGFFLKSSGNNGIFEISTENDLVVKTKQENSDLYDERIKIGRVEKDKDGNDIYGIVIKNYEKENNKNVLKEVFKVDNSSATIAGWNLNSTSIFKEINSDSQIGLYSKGKTANIYTGSVNDQPQYKSIQNCYIIAGNRFAVNKDGYLYASGGTIGGWTITGNTIQSGNNDKYTRLYNDGKIEGKIDSKTSWSISKNGFQFIDLSGSQVKDSTGNQIILGNTKITNNTLYTSRINASGGSIGGCKVNNDKIYGTGWSLSASGLTIGNVTLPSTCYWSDIYYFTAPPSLTVYKNVGWPQGLHVTIDEKRYEVYPDSYWEIDVVSGWGSGTACGKASVLRGPESSITPSTS